MYANAGRPLRYGWLLILVALSGCGSRATEQTFQAKPGNWYCHPDAAGADWECVQDAALAANPPGRDPVRRSAHAGPETGPGVQAPIASAPSTPPPPTPPPPPVEALPPDTGEPVASAESNTLPSPAPDAASPESPGRPDAAPSTTAAPPVATGDTSDLPDWARLAWQPVEPLGIDELPPDYYAVQMVSLASREAVEQYARDHGLQGFSSARIANDGAIRHVLLLGIYETVSAAQRAAVSAQATLGVTDTWVRTVRSLQEAVRAAEALARG